MGTRPACLGTSILIAALLLSAFHPGPLDGQATPGPTHGQTRGEASPPERLTASGSMFPAPAPGTFPASAPAQVARLPVLDNEGREIARAEIEARVDLSGGLGMVLGAVGGLVIGTLVGAVIASSVGCQRAEGLFGPYDNCSPQEEALRSTWLAGGMITGLIGGAYLGWEVDREAWWEVVRDIRRERSRGSVASGATGGHPGGSR